MPHSDQPMAIIKCSCQHDCQDKKYGKGMRAMNPTKTEGLFRCTVCSKTVNYVSPKAAAAEKARLEKEAADNAKKG